jgi:hypothetical protein
MSVATSDNAPAALRDRLRRALIAAMRARDAVAVRALRNALSAIDNAEAVDPQDHGQTAGYVVRKGLGAGEVPRVQLSAPCRRAS